MSDYADIDLEQMAVEMEDFNAIIESQTERLASRFSERLGNELHGAWRAGYDYLHVYQEDTTGNSIARESLTERFSMTYRVLPSNNERPLDLSQHDLYPAVTYDIGSVPDNVIRAAVKGELDSLERINPDR